MTRLDINLLPRKGARELVTQRWFARLRRGSLVLLGVYAVALTAVFGGRFMLNLTKVRLGQQVQVAREKVNELAAVESQQMVVKSKLGIASRALAEGKKWSELMQAVLEFMPDEAAVKEVVLDRDGVLKVTVETANLGELAVMLNALFQIGLERDFVKDVSLERVEKTNAGLYGFTLAFKT